MKQIILGTAGHIDHGKTSLIKAISGTDTDRLKEEKERGITIELGFASLDLPGGQHLGIVDVPVKTDMNLIQLCFESVTGDALKITCFRHDVISLLIATTKSLRYC